MTPSLIGPRTWTPPVHALNPALIRKENSTEPAHPASINPGLRQAARDLIADLESTLSACAAAIDSLTKAHGKAVTLLAADPDNDALKDHVTFFNAQIDGLNTTQSASNHRLVILQQERDGLDAEHARLLGDGPAGILSIEARLADWSGKLTQIAQAAEREESARNQLKSELETKREQLTALQTQLAECGEETRSHESKSRALAARLAQETDPNTKKILSQAQEACNKSGEVLRARRGSLIEQARLMNAQIGALEQRLSSVETKSPLPPTAHKLGAARQVEWAKSDLEKARARLTELGDIAAR